MKDRRSLLATVFVSASETRLRAGWRLLLQVVLQLLLLVLAGWILLTGWRGIFNASSNSWGAAELAVSQVAEFVAVTLSVILARKLLDRRSLGSLGLRLGKRTLLDFAAGVGITCLMMGTIFALEWALGWLHVTRFAWQTQAVDQVAVSVVLFMVVCLLVGWNEELMSRGYHLQTLASGMPVGWAWILSSSVFGVLHLANPHANWIAVFGIVLAGLFLGYAYIRSGQLWLPVGLHTGWNFFEGVVFGFPVSGLPFYRLTHTAVGGPQLWTGGAFGPEAGLVLIPALALGLGLVYLHTRRRSDA